MNRLFLLFGALALTFLTNAQQNPQEDLDDIVCKESMANAALVESALLSNPLTDNYDLKYYRFEWYIDPAVYYIKGKVTVYFQPLEDITEINFDFSSLMTIDSIRFHGVEADYTQSGDYLLTIQLPQTLSSGALDSLTIAYQGAPDSGGFGSFSQTTHMGTGVLWTLSEPFGSQDWWPCKNGLTDKIDSIDVIITTPEEYRAASNGILVEEQTSGTDKIFHWKHRYPIAPYLVAIGVTNYERYTDTVRLSNGVDLPMVNYVYPENLPAAQAGTADLVQVLQFYDSLFVTYPFQAEKYGHCQFGWGGGMEHQTMSYVVSFGWQLLAHELAHQWFGDAITCGSWEDIWLNEGFATYLEGLTRERFLGNDSWYAFKSSRVNTITSQSGGSVKVDDTTSVSRIFSGRLSYSKGAYLLHMLRWKLGDQVFFQGLRNYLNDKQFKYAKTPALKAHLEAVSGLDLTEFFADWYDGQGYPSYTVTWEQEGTNFLIELGQTTSDPSVNFFEMPVPIKLSGDGIDTMLRLDNTYNDQLFKFPISFEVTSVQFDPDVWLISRDNLVMQGDLTGTLDPAQMIQAVLYPNPADQVLHLQLDPEEAQRNMHWQIIDNLGRMVQDGNLATTKEEISIMALIPGLYHLILSDKDGKVGVFAFSKE